jgi:hypothetical protein
MMVRIETALPAGLGGADNDPRALTQHPSRQGDSPWRNGPCRIYFCAASAAVHHQWFGEQRRDTFYV